ncbi:AI-2E family transporter [Thermocoleostomius sinensis]|uniref:AI-2E family transporter n=1 Tax=Thermocoleostomius sinensis A174 TaxID=2016057 RepID=A0A9E9CC38_9CYAN|nr:AI-2E family transporter [Thermocoleostomius sinensis]WAL61895.1 AI-2E family transporter [Thermocoleostomius sinensis A174]
MKFGQLLGLVALLISLYILWRIRQILLLVFLAVVFSTVLNPIVRRLRQSGAKRSFAAVLSVLGFLVLLALFGWLIVPPFINQFELLTQLVPLGLVQLRSWLIVMQNEVPGSLWDNLPRVDDVIRQAQPFVQWTFNNFFSLFSNFLGILLSLLLFIILTVMLLVNPRPYRQGFILLFPAFYRHRVDVILSRCEVSLIGWIRGVLINMAALFVLSAIGLWILRVPLVLANAALAGLLEAIPNIGPTLSLIPPIAIALLDAPWKAGAVLVLYVVIQQLEQFLLVPYVMATQVALLPAVTLISQVIFAIFFGFLGLLLAIPLTIVCQIWIQEVLIKDVLDQWKTHESTP